MKATVTYTGPVLAPIEAGQKLGEMIVEVPGVEPITVPLVAENAVARGGFITHLRTAFRVLSKRVMAEVGS